MFFFFKFSLTGSILLNPRESSLQRLATLQLSDPRQVQRSVQPITLLELFLRGKGICTGLSMLNLQFKKLTDQQWQNTLVPLVKVIGQLVYPFY